MIIKKQKLLFALFLLVVLASWASLRLHRQPAWSPDPQVITEIQARLHPLVTTSPAAEDLQFLKTILAGKRVVVLGEATHGTHEFFTLKHRLIQFLVEEMEFDTIAFEAVTTEAMLARDYVISGQGDPQNALENMYCPWQTQEVSDLLTWLRDYNSAHPQAPVAFAGIDPDVQSVSKSDAAMADEVLRLLSDGGPDSRVVVWVHNWHATMLDEDHMGYWLKQALGDEVYILGMEFSEGSFTSRSNILRYQHTTYTVDAAGPEYYANTLAQTGEPVAYLDFRELCEAVQACDWLDTPQSSHAIDEMYYLRFWGINSQIEQNALTKLYDGLVFVQTSTPVTPLSETCQNP